MTVESVQEREKKFTKKEFTEKGRNQTTYLKAEKKFAEKKRSLTTYLKAEVKGWKG